MTLRQHFQKELKMNRMFRLSSFVFIFLISTPLQAECSKDWAFLYSGPSQYFGQKWQIKPNTPLKVIKSKANWSQVEEFDGVRSWIPKNDLQKKHFCGIVKVPTRGKKTLRSRASEFVPYGSTVKILKFKSSWAQIQYAPDKEVWIPKKRMWVY